MSTWNPSRGNPPQKVTFFPYDFFRLVALLWWGFVWAFKQKLCVCVRFGFVSAKLAEKGSCFDFFTSRELFAVL